jgi:hypothetical protein
VAVGTNCWRLSRVRALPVSAAHLPAVRCPADPEAVWLMQVPRPYSTTGIWLHLPPLLPTPDAHTTVVWLTQGWLVRSSRSTAGVRLRLRPSLLPALFPVPAQGWLFLNSDVDFWQPAQMKAYLGAVR